MTPAALRRRRFGGHNAHRANNVGGEHGALIEQSSVWAATTREECIPAASLATPTVAQDLAMRMIYALGNLSPGQSKTVKLEYGRM